MPRIVPGTCWALCKCRNYFCFGKHIYVYIEERLKGKKYQNIESDFFFFKAIGLQVTFYFLAIFCVLHIFSHEEVSFLHLESKGF